MNELNHVAIIMDGNGRWGLKKRGSRNYGHLKGLNTVEIVIKSSLNQKIPLHQYQGHSSLVKIYSKLQRIINSKTVR